MSLQAVLDTIREMGDAQIREIEARAHSQSQAILMKAQDDVAQLQEQTRQEELAPSTHECACIARQAAFNAYKVTAGAHNSLVEKAIQRARECLAAIRTEAIYPEILERLTREALAELRSSLNDTETIHVEVDPRDRTLLDPILHGLNLDVQVSSPLNCWGGLVVSSQDDRIVVLNTLEARLERALPYLRRQLGVQIKDSELLESDTAERIDSAEA
jgi:vacuolar-type H+-ATPase subunit E/Vma4